MAERASQFGASEGRARKHVIIPLGVKTSRAMLRCTFAVSLSMRARVRMTPPGARRNPRVTKCPMRYGRAECAN